MFLKTLCHAQSLPPRPFPKIPAKLLRDFSQYGSVFSIASKVHELCRARQIKRIDWSSPAKRKEVRPGLVLPSRMHACSVSTQQCKHKRQHVFCAPLMQQCLHASLGLPMMRVLGGRRAQREADSMHACTQNLDMLAQIRRELQREGYLKQPKAHLHATCSADAPRLQRIITQLGGELMASESAQTSILLDSLPHVKRMLLPCKCQGLDAAAACSPACLGGA